MKLGVGVLPVAMALAAAPGALAWAQQGQALYSCRTAAGAVYQSNRPCPSQGSRPVYYGPAPERPRYEPPPANVGAAPGHIRHMSPQCASLHDAIRTGPARGLTYPTLNEMRSNYASQCRDDESQAMRKALEEHRDKQAAKREEELANKRAGERSVLQAQQCGESKRILVTKRARTDLTEGEKAELQRFEENYRARCG